MRGVGAILLACIAYVGSAHGAPASKTPPAIVTTVVPPDTVRPGEHIDTNPDPALDAEDRKHGAVLCAWSIYTQVSIVAAACHAGEDPSFDNRLSGMSARIEAFIATNGNARTAAMVEQGRTLLAKTRAAGNAEHNACNADREKLYQAVRASDPKALARSVDDMLRVPRLPVMNPCL